jgi:4-hydroxy-tetrahydrodipicolinate synthase
MTGEDALLYAALTQGGDGAILASAHVETARFAAIRQMLLAGDHRASLQAWRGLVDVARLLFAEPSPAPIKHWLARARLIDSPEVRAPMMPISASLAARIEREMDVRVAQAA